MAATVKKVSKTKRPKSKIEAHRIIEVMVERDNMSAQELADLIETNPGHMSRILSAKRPCISLPIALKISKALKKPVEDIFFLTKEDLQVYLKSRKK